ncbi:LPS export ABC transporter periplasmic protein LptC [Sulfurimonas microaerophilic]|uniref:LPS export ABC transporter periplasmic protein LptC n=1 Tax=Sulfurimonas microaerophilic TaxID=3058392 RepID=UPI0027147D76|nr:LPS export ABC transporter periplasmic protein LptC [Sulfurimonas sp. hsl 1-7]
MLVITILLSIFFFFQPQKMTQKKFDDVPLLHIKDFTMYELNPAGVKTLMLGSEAFRYNDRYTVDNIDHTDKSTNHISNLRADFGVYKDNKLDLDGNVTLVRDDGLSYKTQKAFYYKDKALFVTDTDYVLSQGKNILRGSYLDHNNLTGKIHSKNINATYHIKEAK